MKSTNRTPDDLAALLAPVDAQTFLQTCWGKAFRHVPGTPGKFSGLLPWAVLNSILEQHRLDPPRLRLTREGKPVPPASWLTYQSNRRSTGQPIPRLRAAELTRHLREGATLVLDAVDDLHPPVTGLAENLERVFRVRIQVNAYAGWRTSHGFDLHWDDHDVFILQVAGRKHWKVYGMTRRYPLAKDVEPNVKPPSEPLWEECLNEGDLLYIPRGWWHVAMPLDEPTLHLTVGVNNLTGADLLSWFVERLRACDEVRRDIPHLSGEAEQFEFARCLGDILLERWEPDLIQQYLQDMDAKSRPRPHLNLPWAATPGILPPGQAGYRVKWNGSRPRIEPGRGGPPGEVAVLANGRRWRFAEAALPVLEMLTSGRICTAPELYARAVPVIDSGTVDALLKELVTEGLIYICDDAAVQEASHA